VPVDKCARTTWSSLAENPAPRDSLLTSHEPFPARLLPVDRIDVWRIDLDRQVPDGLDLAPLSADERDRAARFHFEIDRKRFQCCRSALRLILGHYLRIAPETISFQYQINGKPELRESQNAHALQFNVSHSGAIGLIAFTLEAPIGVDIEKARPDVDFRNIARRFFSSREVAELTALPEALQLEGFVACWSRKESFIKAIGEGLSYPLKDFSVSVDPLGDVTLISVRDELPERWFLRDITVQSGYHGAVCVQSLPRPLHLRTYDFAIDMA
jgi:4'-phosphopantetheinyl transferase